ncbi:hypothetical protein JCM10213_001994 [Rhodosporidiobolus nylandii]
MPSSCQQLAVQGRTTISCKLDLDPADALGVTTEIESPFAGEWTLGADRHQIWVQLMCPFDSTIERGSMGSAVKQTMQLFWVADDGGAHLLQETSRSGPLPLEKLYDYDRTIIERLTVEPAARERAAINSHGAFEPDSHRNFLFVLELQQDEVKQDEDAHAADEKKREGARELAQHLAERMSNLHTKRLPHDVRLFFPRPRNASAELWASGALLAAASPFFEDLLASGFTESAPRKRKRARKNSVPEVESTPLPSEEDEKDFEDSDDETDAFLFFDNPPKLDDSPETEDLPYKEVKITHTAFSTYSAVLTYLDTGHITFAPLSSSFASSEDRAAYLTEHLKEYPTLPLPISAKSAARLASFLSLDVLQNLALDSFRASLTPSNAAVELCDTFTATFPQARQAVLAFVAEHQEDVKASEGWKEMVKRIKHREIPDSVALDLILELTEKGINVFG